MAIDMNGTAPNSHASSELREQIINAIRLVFDPELPVNIYDLGLIYELAINDDASVQVRMTLTTPNCPVADILPQQVKTKVAAVPGVSKADVQVVWEPPWSPERMSDVAKLELELRGIPDLSHIHNKHRLTNVTIGRKPDRHQ